MRRHSGFTLLEVMVTIAIIAVLATASFAVMRSATRNADLSSASSELSMLLAGLPTVALSEGRDQLLVFTDAANNDAEGCAWTNLAACSRYFHVDAPDGGWTLTEFDATNPGAHAQRVVDSWVMPRGVRLLSSTATPPAPFSNIPLFPSDYTAECAGNRKCFAIRFTASGDVVPEPKSTPAPTVPATGYAFVLAGRAGTGPGADRRAVLVTSPSGIVKSYSVSE